MSISSPTTCPLCKSSANPFRHGIGVFKCQSCGLQFRNPSSMEELDHLYLASWEEPDTKVEETGATSIALAREYIFKLIKTLGKKDLRGLTILDHGAGRGAMLQALVEAGVDAYGVEPFGYEYLLENGFRVFRSVKDLPEGIRFDGILSLEVIEHVPTPWVDYAELRKYLAIDGWLCVSTPNAGGFNALISQDNWREYHKKGHLFFFEPTSLENVLMKSGYVKIQKLKWFINYGRGPMMMVFHWLLQFFAYDGELRYLSFNP